jgi:hypothetical protein
MKKYERRELEERSSLTRSNTSTSPGMFIKTFEVDVIVSYCYFLA